jgi:cell division protein FtsB
VLRLTALILMIVLLYLGVKLWSIDMPDVWRLQQRVADQKVENQKLKQRNEALSAEVEDLKNGKEAVEERARSELGLVKPGEAFYQVVEPAPSSDKKDNDGHH